MKVYILTYKTVSGSTLTGAVYSNLLEAKEEAARLDKQSPFGSAMIIIRNLIEQTEDPNVTATD